MVSEVSALMGPRQAHKGREVQWKKAAHLIVGKKQAKLKAREKGAADNIRPSRFHPSEPHSPFAFPLQTAH